MTAPGGGSWLAEWPSRLTAMVDLLCFPGAGAGASAFRGWAAALPGYAALLACQLPGRENRLGEVAADSLDAAAGEVAAAYARLRPSPRPLVLFGHSMGGALAFETARRLAQAGRPPFAIVISASAPPRGTDGGAELDAEALKTLLLAYDPDNSAITANDELFDSLAPILRTDIALLRRHRVAPDAALEVRACLLAGGSDAVVSPEAVARWAGHFTGPVEHEQLPGGHHFPFRDSRDAVLLRLARLLRQALGAGAAP